MKTKNNPVIVWTVNTILASAFIALLCCAFDLACEDWTASSVLDRACAVAMFTGLSMVFVGAMALLFKSGPHDNSRDKLT